MARLPQPGGDQGSWGEVLNDFLKTSLNTDGTIKANAINASHIPAGAIDVSKILTTAAPQIGQVLSWNGSQLRWIPQATVPNTPNISVVTNTQWQAIQPGANDVLYIVIPG